MNNFIVGQVTPDMLNTMQYGTFIFFGLLTFLGAFFIIFFTPETKCLSLEEMDVVFGSAGVAAADAERMADINREVGLNDILGGRNAVTEKEESPAAGEVSDKEKL